MGFSPFPSVLTGGFSPAAKATGNGEKLPVGSFGEGWNIMHGG